MLPRSPLELLLPLELAGSALAGSPLALTAMAEGFAPKRRPQPLAAGLLESHAHEPGTLASLHGTAASGTLAYLPGTALAPEPGTLAPGQAMTRAATAETRTTAAGRPTAHSPIAQLHTGHCRATAHSLTAQLPAGHSVVQQCSLDLVSVDQESRWAKTQPSSAPGPPAV